MPLRTLAQRCKRFTPLLAAPAAPLLTQRQAKAVLTYNIFDSGGNVVAQTSGSLNLTGSQTNSTASCGVSGAIISASAPVCTGPDATGAISAFLISGPDSFNGSVLISPTASVSGTFTTLVANTKQFALDPAYVSNTPIVSSATFNGTSLAALGFTTTGLIGTWTLDGTSESIYLCIGSSPCAPAPSSVPGPLPLLGAGAAFGWSRRLRKRIAAPLITPPQT